MLLGSYSVINPLELAPPSVIAARERFATALSASFVAPLAKIAPTTISVPVPPALMESAPAPSLAFARMMMIAVTIISAAMSLSFYSALRLHRRVATRLVTRSVLMI